MSLIVKDILRWHWLSVNPATHRECLPRACSASPCAAKKTHSLMPHDDQEITNGDMAFREVMWTVGCGGQEGSPCLARLQGGGSRRREDGGAIGSKGERWRCEHRDCF